MIALEERATVATTPMTPCRRCDRPCLRAGLEKDGLCVECNAAEPVPRHTFAVGKHEPGGEPQVSVCAWCEPTPDGVTVSHKICPTCEAAIREREGLNEETRHSDRHAMTGSRRGGAEAPTTSTRKLTEAP